MHVPEALRRRHRSELDATVEGVFRVLQVQVGRAPVCVETCSVGGEAPVDFAYLCRHLLEAVHEALPSGAAHCLELALHVLDLSPCDIRLARSGLHVLRYALQLLHGLQVWAEALQLHTQAFQFSTVLLLQHLGRRPCRGGPLLFGQRGEINRNGPRSRCRRGRLLLLRRRTGRLGWLHCKVLQGLQAAAEQGHLHVFEHALPQDVRPRAAKHLLLRA
mmetsp:Transcript_125115/g.348154  ORF Transcript_125115/g.348154 Transcript_125115/m.348154 type:complete len:218 (+) Transcript_125115:411-1064(+)